MLRQFPFETIGDIARLGLELHVYCPRCFATRRLDLEMNTALHGRAFATRAADRQQFSRSDLRQPRCAAAPAAEAGDNASVPVVQLMHLGDRPAPARQAAVVGKPLALSL